MSTKIFVNLPVKDLTKSIEFFTKLGFKFNPKLTDENAAVMIAGDDIFINLLAEKYFKIFTNKEICDATKSTEAMICLSVDSKAKVDEMLSKAKEAGGSVITEKPDIKNMYWQSFYDLDGHLWEILFLDPNSKI